MESRKLSIISGISYLIIFFTAIFANFFVLEAIVQDPVGTVQGNQMLIRIGTMAFLIAVVFDVVVAWALYELFKKHPLTTISTYFRLMHAAIFGVAIFALPQALISVTSQEILSQVNILNTIWLIGLFFFGIHLVMLGKIMQKPRPIAILLMIAGIMYMADTSAHFLLMDYQAYASVFLALVAIPSIVAEMSFALWLLFAGGRGRN